MSTATRSPTTSASSIPQIFGFSRELGIPSSCWVLAAFDKRASHGLAEISSAPVFRRVLKGQRVQVVPLSPSAPRRS